MAIFLVFAFGFSHLAFAMACRHSTKLIELRPNEPLAQRAKANCGLRKANCGLRKGKSQLRVAKAKAMVGTCPPI